MAFEDTVAASSKISVCGVGIDPLGLDATRTRVLDMRSREKFGYVVTPNAQHLVNLVEGSGELKRLYAEAALCVNDSRVIAKVARILLGIRLPVCPGSDLTREILSELNEQGSDATIIGMDAQFFPRLQAKFPRINFHHYNPPMGFIRSDAEVQSCLDFLSDHPAPIYFFAVGFPRQEVLASRFSNQANARGVGLCIGASLDFLVGAQVRAPEFMQKIGMEWAFRLLQDPGRMARRYLIESPRAFWYCWKYRRETWDGFRE
ncbi:WecB/TagA/CpsF family glycosyltransferase [Hwanghaeella sp.]|uniref:WecB/TagA/CpsF family glycosyltransferase n=1 Tax=Hwanghaeella sp. TaxID=2605943 RepID=UPI003CCB8F77